MAGNRKSRNNTTTNRNASGAAKQKKAKSNRSGNGDNAITAFSSGGINSGSVFNRGPRGQTWFSNTEFVIDVLASPVISATNVVPLNPSTPSTFPWLSRIATGFELYRFTKLRIVYSPSCSTATSGLIVGAFEYDANDAVPTNKQQISAMDRSARGNLWGRQVFDLACNKAWFYVSSSGGVGDPRLSDVARFFYAVYGATATGTVGELSIEYTVEFMKPEAALPLQSENIQVFGSNLPTLGGTSQNVVGDPLFTVSSGAAGVMNLTMLTSGQYQLQFTLTCQSSAAPSGANPIPTTTVFRGNNAISGAAAYSDCVIGFSAPATTYYAMVTMLTNVLTGDVISIAAASVMTLLTVNRIRASSYKMING